MCLGIIQVERFLDVGTPCDKLPTVGQAPSEQSIVIRSIQIVNVKDLKPEVRSKVEDLAAKTSEDDLRSLRESIDATPEVVSALKSKGLSSSQVVAVNSADGILTIFAKIT